MMLNYIMRTMNNKIQVHMIFETCNYFVQLHLIDYKIFKKNVKYLYVFCILISFDF
jgi:hypothetical protein